MNAAKFQLPALATSKTVVPLHSPSTQKYECDSIGYFSETETKEESVKNRKKEKKIKPRSTDRSRLLSHSNRKKKLYKNKREGKIRKRKPKYVAKTLYGDSDDFALQKDFLDRYAQGIKPKLEMVDIKTECIVPVKLETSKKKKQHKTVLVRSSLRERDESESFMSSPLFSPSPPEEMELKNKVTRSPRFKVIPGRPVSCTWLTPGFRGSCVNKL